MKKQRIGAVLLAGAMVLSMTGCGSNKAKAYSDYVQLGNYTGIEYTRTVAEVTEDDVQAQLDSFVSSLSETKEVTDRAVESGDIVNIDYVGTKDGVAFDGGTAEGYDLTIGSGSFIEGFEDGLIGHNIGEVVSLNLTFPEDYGTEDLAGQDVVFEVTINSISQEMVPELTDDLVSENTDYDTIDAYKESIEEDLKAQNEESADSQADADIFAKVVENTTVTGYDEAEVTELIDMSMASFEQMATSYSSYGYTYADVLSMYGYDSEEALKEGLTEYAKEYLNQKMIVYMIADAEGLKVTSEEREELVEETISMYGVESEEDLYETAGLDEDYFEITILSEKVTEFLRENAVLVDSTEASSEEAADGETEEATEAE